MHDQRRITAKIITVLCLAILAGLFIGSTALAQGELMRLSTSLPVEVRADKVTYDDPTASYLAEGEVEISQGPNRLIADKVRLFSKTMVAEAEGRVRLITPEQVASAESLVVNLNSGLGKMYNAHIFVKPSNYHLRGEELEKTGKDTYEVKYGRFTTCDGQSPAWEITGSDMEVTLEGYGTAKNTAFRIKDVPVLWSPYMIFPAKFKRQSGLLAPMFGTSKRDGITASIPYFQVLGEDQDATLTLNYMARRGVDLGLEYRYVAKQASKYMAMIDYMPHDSMGEELYKTGENAEKYDSRYWFRMMGDQELFNGKMNLKADIDLVSDQDYLREFVYGYSGFDASNSRFLQMFGRDLDPNTSTTRNSEVNLSRSWSAATLNATLYYFDDLTTDNRSTLQQLPTLSFDATRQALGETGIYFNMNSDYTYYYRQEGSTGSISDVIPNISYPMNFSDYIEIEPSVAWQQRFFSVSESQSGDWDETGTNYLWSFTNAVSTYMYKVYDLGSAGDPLKIKHAFRPNITYNYQPNINEDDIAPFARIGANRSNYVSYGINNTLTSKVIDKDPETGQLMPMYREFMRLNLSQAFDVNQMRQDGDADINPWGNIVGRVEYLPTDRIYFESEAALNPSQNRWDQVNSRLIFSDLRGDEVEIEYRFTHDSVKQVNTRLKLALNEEWWLAYIYRTDLITEEDFESTYEIAYEGQCWGIRAFYTDNIREQGFYLAFSLGGFGELFGWGRLNSQTN